MFKIHSQLSRLLLLGSFIALPVFCAWGQTPNVSEETEISIITVGPGKNLYDKFGHTAIRVDDPAFDLAFNYGVYDFNTPNFYTKFARGKLLYKLDVEYFDGFIRRYQAQNRWVKEQVLDLNFEEKSRVFNFLLENAKPENQEYLYDFLFDNCATKPRDVFKDALGSSISYSDTFINEPRTLRQLIQMNVPANSWGSLGMDVGIGAVVDREATAWEHQFLPYYVAEAAAVASLSKGDTTKPLVKESRNLFVNNPQKEKSNFLTSPLFVFGLISLLILWITFKDHRSGKRSRHLDGAIFFFTGLVGVILSILWWGTDHSTTANNYNLLWAFPFSLLFFIGIVKRQPRKWLQRYVVFLLLMMVLLCIHWITGVQEFAIGFIPFFIALVVRYVFLIKNLKRSAGD